MEQGPCAPDSTTMPVILGDFDPPSHRPFGRGRLGIPAVTPLFDPAMTPDTPR